LTVRWSGGHTGTRLGEIRLFLHDTTPKHKRAFLDLTREDYWRDFSFNRVIPGFVAQAGCPDTAEGFAYCPHLLAPEIRPELRHRYLLTLISI
jgi:peptidyl-prolyl cis-trans isomerase B (cyclophilin B)